jgi:hypothetical protein
MDTKLTPEMIRWMENGLLRAESIDIKVKGEDDGNYVRTPWKLCEDIVSRIFDISNKRVLVVDTIEFIPVLLAFGVNKCNITFVAQYEFRGMMAQQLGVHVVPESLLTWKTNMKFDVVIGNPPYQTGRNRYFYQEFVTKAWTLSDDVVAMITPSNWVSLTKMNSKFTKNVLAQGLLVYKYLGGNAFKDVQLLTVYFVTSKKSVNSDVELITSQNSTKVNRTQLKYFPSDSGEGVEIIAKLKQFTIGCLQEIHGTLTRGRAVPSTDTNCIKCIYSAGRKGGDFDWECVEPTTELVGFGDHKVIVTHQTSIGKLGEVKYAGPEYGIGLSAHAFVVSNEIEAKNLIAYLESNVIRFIFKSLKGAVCSNSQVLFSNIPKLDFSKSWTDQELYNHFNLTQDEIDYIEVTVK